MEELQRVAVTQRIESVPEPETGLAVEFSDIWMEAGPLSGRTSLIIGPTGRIPPLTPAGEERKTAGKMRGLPNGPIPMRIGRGASDVCDSGRAVPP